MILTNRNRDQDECDELRLHLDVKHSLTAQFNTPLSSVQHSLFSDIETLTPSQTHSDRFRLVKTYGQKQPGSKRK